MTERLILLFMVMLGALCGACQQDAPHEHAHEGDDPHAHGDASHGHAHGGHEGSAEAVTRYGEQNQLFVEFPALVRDAPSAFAAHLTRLSEHAPLETGTVVVELSSVNAPPETFSVEGPSVPGIFRPVVTPAQAGLRHVTLRVEETMLTETYDLGDFMVFETRQQADTAGASSSEVEGEISYLLEQQWKTPFRVAQAVKRDIRPNLATFAQLTLPPEAAVTITAPQSGRLASASGELPGAGDAVKQGETLFTLRSAPEQGGERATLDLEVERAAIDVTTARREVERLAPLLEQGVVPQRRLDEAQSALEQAIATQRAAQRRRNTLLQSQKIASKGEGIVVPSPIDGQLMELLVTPGAWVERGTPLARVVSSEARSLWLDVYVPQAHLARLGDVSGAWIEVGHGEALRVVELPKQSLVSIGSQLDPVRRALPVRFRLEGKLEGLYGGMILPAHLITQAPRQAVAIPISALVDEAGSEVVYVQRGGERFTRRAVRLGERDGAVVEVLDGVEAGEWVVARGAYGVKLASSSTESIGHGHAH